jgi:hypothetical protein
MALPGMMGASLAEAIPPEEGDDGGIEAILADIDEKVPGLGALIHELVDRIKADDAEQDASEE